jgi:acetyltransferase-like isoleucine patch superfamily enzyme
MNLNQSSSPFNSLDADLPNEQHPAKANQIRSFLKSLVRAVALLVVAPALILYCFSAIFGREKTFPGFAQAFSLIPGITGQFLRHAFYSAVLKNLGRDSCLTFGTIFSHASAQIGNDVYIGAFCSIGDVTIEDDVLLASHVSIMNGSQQHGIERLDIPIREQPGTMRHITIGSGSWIGERALVSADIGKHCVIGAGAIVTKPIPDYAIAVGVPAKVLRFRNSTDENQADLEPSEDFSFANQLDHSLATT